MIHHVLASLNGAGDLDRVIVVVGNGRDRVIAEVKSIHPDAIFVDQMQLRGTGDAVRCCQAALADFEGDVLVLPGDGPLLREATLSALVWQHQAKHAQATVVAARLENPTGYGRIVRGPDNQFEAIVEQADTTEDQRAIKEVSGGIWLFDKAALFDALGQISDQNAQGEYYLTDTVLAIRAKGGSIYTLMANDPTEIEGVNDRLQLAAAERKLRQRYLEELAVSGVSIEDPFTTYIDVGVQVGPGTVIKPLTFLEGRTTVGSGCSVGPSTRIVDSVIEDGAEVTFSIVRESSIGPKAMVGPYASIRPGTTLGPGAKAGTFVEIKGSAIGEGSKVPHLSYIGDAEVGKGVNLGAGTITGNYDSENKLKAKTTIGDGAFTGSDTTLIAPVSLGANAGTGAGSVVTKDVAEGEIVVGVPAKPFRKRRSP